MDKTALVILTVGVWLTAAPAYAYIDPGTGGLLVQLLTGGVAGVAVLLRLYWHKVRSILGFTSRGSEASSSSSIPTDERG